jgi:Tfp pilus assembly protein PilN
MINLLPEEMKEDFHYGRRNSQIIRWLMTVIFGILMLLVVAAIGRLTIQTARNQTLAQKQVVEDQLKTADFDTINGEYSDFSTGLSNVKKLYQQQVLYSRLIRKLGTLLPPGAKITNISISDKDRAVSLNFDNDSEGMGPTIQLNLTDQSKQVANKTTLLFNDNLKLTLGGTPTTDNTDQTVRFYVNASGIDDEKRLKESLKSGGDLAFYAVKPALNGYLIDYDIIMSNGKRGVR